MRGNHYDVSDQLRISHPADVGRAINKILGDLFPDQNLSPVDLAIDTFAHLYAGTLPGYQGCDTWYHDAQHSLDCALAYARLLDGHERSVSPGLQLGLRRAVLRLIISLFHDAGDIRLNEDRADNGAEFTMCHVQRSADFQSRFLPALAARRRSP